MLADVGRFQSYFYFYLLILITTGAYRVLYRSCTSSHDMLADVQKQNIVGAEECIKICRLLVVAMYFWAGYHKFNYSFATHGIIYLLQPFVVLEKELHMNFLVTLTVMTVISEIGTSLALLFPRYRRFGIWGSCFIHAVAFISIGPLGRNVNSVIWPWQLSMPLLTVVLFAGSDEISQLIPQSSSYRVKIIKTWGFLAALLVVIMPPLCCFGVWDSTPSFKLYSSNTEYGGVWVTREEQEFFPVDVKGLLDENNFIRLHVNLKSYLSEYYSIYFYIFSKLNFRTGFF